MQFMLYISRNFLISKRITCPLAYIHVVCIRMKYIQILFLSILKVKHQTLLAWSWNLTFSLSGRMTPAWCMATWWDRYANTNAWPEVHTLLQDAHALLHTRQHCLFPFPHHTQPHSPAVSLLYILTIRWHARSLSLAGEGGGWKMNALWQQRFRGLKTTPVQSAGIIYAAQS